MQIINEESAFGSKSISFMKTKKAEVKEFYYKAGIRFIGEGEYLRKPWTFSTEIGAVSWLSDKMN